MHIFRQLWVARLRHVRCAAALFAALVLPCTAMAQNLPFIAAVSPATASLADHLRVTIDKLEGSDQARYDPASFRLRLNEHKFAEVEPERVGPNEFSFDLSKLRQDQAGWLSLVGSPPFSGVKQVYVSIATSGMVIGGSANHPATMNFQVFRQWKLAVISVIALLITAAMVRLTARTSLLRDRKATSATSIRDIPFSLARCQVAFWFIIVLWSFLAIWLVTGDYNNIVSAQSLTLLGISGATALSAIFVDYAKPAVEEAGTVLPPPTHRSFWSDLLTDDTGWAFHRFQVVVWTLVLGLVSLWSVRETLALPTFDNNLLILMGISSGLYVGAKWPEQQSNKALPVGASPVQGGNSPAVNPAA